MRIIRYYPRAWKGDGGIRNSVCRISEALVRAGARVSVAIEQDDATPSREVFDWLPVRHDGPRRFRRPVGLAEHLKKADLLVLHSAWVYHNNWAASLARKLGVPYVLEPRGAYDPFILRRRRLLKSFWWHAFERRLVRHAAAVHIFFESEREHLSAIGYRGPAITAPNGIAVPDEAHWDGGSGGYVLWIGRFDPEHKGLDLLLRAMHRLKASKRPKLRLHGPDWVGGKPRVIRMVEDLNLGDHVQIGSPVYGHEKWRLIREAAAFVYPSRWEGFGNSPAEAVAAGVPTLVTPYPLGRWLSARGAAFLAEATPEGLAEGLLAVVRAGSDPEAVAARRQVREALSWDAVARSWLEQAAAAIAGSAQAGGVPGQGRSDDGPRKVAEVAA